jgi:hypothetical protein
VNSYDSSSYFEVKADGTISEQNIVEKLSRINNFLDSDEIDTFISLLKSVENADVTIDVVNTGNDLIVTTKRNPILISEQRGMSFTSYDGKITFKIDGIGDTIAA